MRRLGVQKEVEHLVLWVLFDVVFILIVVLMIDFISVKLAGYGQCLLHGL